MIKPSTTRFLSGLLALGVVSSALDGVVLVPTALARTTSAVELRLRRSPGRVDVVIAGLGTEVRAMRQNQSDRRWSARLTGVDLGDRPFMPQQLVIPSSELLSVRLEPLDSDLQLIVQARMGERVPRPTIASNGESLVVSFAGLTGPEMRSTGRLDLRRPGRVAQPVMAPPMRPRAVAPPLGDMAVGTMLISNRSFVQASGPPVSLTLNQAPAKDALMSLARLGGYGFVFVGGSKTSTDVDNTEYPVTMSFQNEPYDRALNSVLMSSGLQGRLDGNTLLVGTAASAKSFGPQMSKVFRMNQVDVASASQYLGNLGAVIAVTNTSTVEGNLGDQLVRAETMLEIQKSANLSGEESSARSSVSSPKKKSSGNASPRAQGTGYGPLMGLTGTTDSRLNTITLVGDPKLIAIAETYLKQIDLRKRQVAVKVQILSITVDNDTNLDSSFSAKIGNTFIVSQSGKAHMNFGTYKPGSPLLGTGTYNGSEFVRPGTYPSFSEKVQAQDVVDPYIVAKDVDNPITTNVYDEDGEIIGQEIEYPDLLDEQGRPVYVPDSNPNAAQQLVPQYDKYGRPVYVDAKENGSFKYPKNSFYSYLEAVIISSSSKTLAQPTLLVQEGEKASVRAGESVITGVNKNEGANGSTQFSNTRETAGLTVNLEVEKIDDNGFITLQLDPTISVPISAGQQEGVQIFNIETRELSSGRIRLRDQQTLILSGVLQDSDRQFATKWPLLGDLPLIGQLFRSSSSNRQKNELVIIVTPSVLDDDNGGAYGYGYKPSTSEVTRLIGSGSNR